jgi:hypothetical protein
MATETTLVFKGKGKAVTVQTMEAQGGEEV